MSSSLLIVGNWKMNLDVPASLSLAKSLSLADKIHQSKHKIGIVPSFTALYPVAHAVETSPILLGAQNAYFKEKGAFTGEVSFDMLKSTRCQFVILGHSERRTIFKESNELINKKVAVALEELEQVILCVGENLEERESGKMNHVIGNQLKQGLKNIHIEKTSKIVIAYEPIWAIGTGKTATTDEAESAHIFIREMLSSIFSPKVADNIIIQYGGSVTSKNASGLFRMPNVGGVLVGGASLNLDEFLNIIPST